MEGEGLLRDARLRVGALVCVCFALGPAGYFAWFYNAAALTDAATVDFYTLVLAYFVQAAGVGAYMAARRSLAGEFAGGSIEMSRLFYGVGLVVAGVAADRDRRLALACCAASLAVPFLQLALEGFEVSGFVLWSLGYLLQGFFVVWRVVLFSDIVDASGCVWLAGAGLVFGRIGDAFGTWLTQALTPWPVALVASAFALFALSYFLLFRVWSRMYGTAAGTDAEAVRDEYDPLVEFCGEHGLSMREREVLYFVLAGRTNAETAHELGVTEGTVKFHMTNILKKTGCATRNEVAKLYNRSLRNW